MGRVRDEVINKVRCRWNDDYHTRAQINTKEGRTASMDKWIHYYRVDLGFKSYF